MQEGVSGLSSGAIDQVRLWTEQEFRVSKDAWEDLRARSDADPLFMGWDWQWLWWHHHRELLEGTLSLISCYAGSRLVGLAPLYLHSARHRAGIRSTRMEIIGSTWRDGRGVFSEYLDLIADRGWRAEVAAAVGNALRLDSRWSDLVISNAPASGVAARMVRDGLVPGVLLRETDPMEAHRAALPDNFPDYLSSLAGGVRRKLWNHRVKLTDPQLVIAGPKEVAGVFHQIDMFHIDRWNAPQYVGVARDFHFALAPRLLEQGALRMSTLYAGGAPLAVMYNVRLGCTEYNIQSGFDVAKAVGISPGYLHFGYSLEEACRDGVRQFDFLAGEGRNRQYKQDFVTTAFPLVTFQAIRAAHLKLLYRAHGLASMWKAGRSAPLGAAPAATD